MISIFTTAIRRLATSLTMSAVRRMGPIPQRIAKGGGALIAGGVTAVSDPRRIYDADPYAVTASFIRRHRIDAQSGIRMDLFKSPQSILAARRRGQTHLSDLTPEGQLFAVTGAAKHISSLGFKPQDSSLFGYHDQGFQRLSDRAIIFRWVPHPPALQHPLFEWHAGLQRHTPPAAIRALGIRRNSR